MIDIGKEKINLNCPHCKKKHFATLNDAMNKKIIHCSCGTNIQLKDNGSVKKSLTDISKAFKDLDNVFKKIGK